MAIETTLSWPPLRGYDSILESTMHLYSYSYTRAFVYEGDTAYLSLRVYPIPPSHPLRVTLSHSQSRIQQDRSKGHQRAQYFS
jgi:hypothetical protein